MGNTFLLGLLAGSLAIGAAAGRGKLTESQQKNLDRDGFVITNTTLKQGFSAYIGGRYPAFVTSDSLLMVHGCLLERVMADQQVSLMAAHIQLLLEMGAKLPKEDAAPGVKETRLLVACMHGVLLGHLPRGLSAAEVKLVSAELKRVEAASAKTPPEWWWGEGYMPYSRFKPIGVWATNKALGRYFKYRQWLQSLPLSSDSKLHKSVCKGLYQVLSKVKHEVRRGAFGWQHLAGRDGGMLRAISNIGYIDLDNGSAELERQLEILMKKSPSLLIATATPEKDLLDRSLAVSASLEGLSLEVGKALGNKTEGFESRAPKESAVFQKRVSKGGFHRHDTAFFRALYALRSVDKRAPKLFSSNAWQRKQLNCALSAWVEYRHAIAITQTTSAHWMGLTEESPGFLEPVPEFYQHLGQAVRRLAEISLGNQKMRREAAPLMLALKLETFAEKLVSVKGEGHRFAWNQERLWGKALNKMFEKKKQKGELSFGYDRWDFSDDEERKKLAERIRAACARFWKQDEETKKLFWEHSAFVEDVVTQRVLKLESLCYRLEAMCRKQLAGQAWSPDEADFITGYGRRIAYLMFHEGNSYLTPEDDAPRIVQIAHLGSPQGEKVLQCATARPRKLLLFYPNSRGERVLCQGAVYSFREHVSSNPMTDAAWREACRKSKKPKWLVEISEK